MRYVITYLIMAILGLSATGLAWAQLENIGNFSARGIVGTQDEVLIAGFIVGGQYPMTVVIRGRGPSLADPPFFLPQVLANPFLQIYSGSTLIASNDDWRNATSCRSGYTCGTASQVQAARLDPCEPNLAEQISASPGCNLESAIMITLPPGGYTAILSGAKGGVGVGLIEVFQVAGQV